MKCYTLTLGARNTPAAGKKFSRADDELIRRITCAHFTEGVTILNADGGWFGPARKAFVAEASRQIIVCASRRAQLRPWCAQLARELQQRELLVIETGTATLFRTGRQKPKRTQRKLDRNR